MIEDCEEKGLAGPIWLSKSGVTSLTFPGITVTAKTNDTVNGGLIDAVSDALNDAVKSILTDDKGVSINQVMKSTGKSNATVKRYLQILKIAGLVEFKGSAKTGKYFMNKKVLAKMKMKQ